MTNPNPDKQDSALAKLFSTRNTQEIICNLLTSRATLARHTTQEETMSYTRNFFTREPKSSRKKRKETERLQNVISLRINDDEKNTLEKLTKTTSKSITEIMREAMDLWRSKQRKLCM